MSEIEKLYENAGVEKDLKSMPYGDIEEYYPPFTAEKQLELIKWLIKNCGEICLSLDIFGEIKSWEIVCNKFSTHRNTFEKCLVGFVNDLWQDLTEEKKAEIKRILE